MEKINFVKTFLNTILISLIGVTGIIFTVLYIETFSEGIWYKYSNLFTAVSVGLISALTILTLFFFKSNKNFIYKLFFIFIVFIMLVTCGLYFLKSSGFLDKIDSVSDFREYIESYNDYAVILFILVQLLQVVILPIPSFITVGAGVLLFGPFRGAIYSTIGIIIGSLIAFFIGRVFGAKVAKWLVGEKELKKGLKAIKGKDKIVLTAMFLFPFFPDDVLCFVAGMTTMSSLFFVIMITITRVITVFASSYSINNSIIPYDTWWGILLWVLFFTFTIIVTIFIYKKGDKIENAIFKKQKSSLNKRQKVIK